MCTPFSFFGSMSSIPTMSPSSKLFLQELSEAETDEDSNKENPPKDVSHSPRKLRAPLTTRVSARLNRASNHESKSKNSFNSNKRSDDNLPFASKSSSGSNSRHSSNVSQAKTDLKTCPSISYSSQYSVDSTYSTRNSKGHSGHQHVLRGSYKVKNQVKMSKSADFECPKASSSSQEEYCDQSSSSKGANFLKFPQKLWGIINDSKSNAIKWGPNGDTILINYDSFQEEYLGENRSVFKTRNVASFIRQLNLYGFRKVNHSHSQLQSKALGVYAHEFKHNFFKHGREDLLSAVTRKYSGNTTYTRGSKYDNDDDLYEPKQQRAGLGYKVVKKSGFGDHGKRRKNSKHAYKNGTNARPKKSVRRNRDSVDSDADEDPTDTSPELGTSYESEDLMEDALTEAERPQDDSKVEKCQKVLEDVLNKQKAAFKGEHQLPRSSAAQLAFARRRRKYVFDSRRRFQSNHKRIRPNGSVAQSSTAEELNAHSDPLAPDDAYWSSSKGSQSSHSSGNVTLIMDPSTTPTKTHSYKRQQIIEELIYDSVLDQFDHLLGAGDTLTVATPAVFASLEEVITENPGATEQSVLSDDSKPKVSESVSLQNPKVIVATAYGSTDGNDLTAAYGSFYAEQPHSSGVSY